MDYSYENLEASYGTGPDTNFEFLCRTYLGDMSYLAESPDEGGEYFPVVNEEPFRQIPISAWQSKECEQWLQSIMNRQENHYDSSILWRFQSFTGQQILRLTQQDFINFAGQDLGGYFFKELQHLRRKQSELNLVQQSSEISQGELFEDSYLLYDTSSQHDFNPPMPVDLRPPNIDMAYGDPGFHLLENLNYEQTSGGFSDDFIENLFSKDTQNLGTHCDISHGSNGSGLVSDQHYSHLQHQYPEESFDQVPESFPDNTTSPGPSIESSLYIPSDEMLGKVQGTRRKRERGPKNWEFLMRLLADQRTNPAIIEWEDEATGTFRLRQPAIIAKIWASRNDKQTDLSYDNFARGLRHHYPTGVLIPIPERQLVYRCGPKALKFLEELKKSSN